MKSLPVAACFGVSLVFGCTVICLSPEWPCLLTVTPQEIAPVLIIWCEPVSPFWRWICLCVLFNAGSLAGTVLTLWLQTGLVLVRDTLL